MGIETFPWRSTGMDAQSKFGLIPSTKGITEVTTQIVIWVSNSIFERLLGLLHAVEPLFSVALTTKNLKVLQFRTPTCGMRNNMVYRKTFYPLLVSFTSSFKATISVENQHLFSPMVSVSHTCISLKNHPGNRCHMLRTGLSNFLRKISHWRLLFLMP